MQTCPHCHKEVNLAELRYQGMWVNYRQCPYCNRYFAVDKKTKKRQAIFIVLTLVSLALTMLLYYNGLKWLLPAIISYIIIGIGIYWANKRVFLIPYDKDEKKKST